MALTVETIERPVEGKALLISDDGYEIVLELDEADAFADVLIDAIASSGFYHRQHEGYYTD